MVKKIKEKSKTLNEVIRIKIQDKDIYGLNRLYLIDKISDIPSFPIENRDQNKLNTTKLIQKNKILVQESELIRMLKLLNPINLEYDHNDYPFVRDLVILKVGRGSTKYKELENKIKKHSGVLFINDIPYKRIICASGHNRAKKIMMIRKDLFYKIQSIALCGLNERTNFLPSKFNAYFGLIASDSKFVNLPNIVVVEDHSTNVHGVYDVVSGDVTKKIYETQLKRKKLVQVEIGQGEYNVETIEKDLKILPFDGAGLVDVSRVKLWMEELKLDYIPASFQFRCIPAMKGNLFTFDIMKFSEIYGVTKMIDIWGKEWDIIEDHVDCIMTRSQFKFAKLFDSFEDWKTAFETDEFGYHRTFNISEVAVACRKPSKTSTSRTLKDTTLMCYQPLQTLELTDDEIENLCARTVKDIKKIHSDVDAFLRYRGLEDNEDIEWSTIPPYYKALKYNHSLFNDEYIQNKIKADLDNMIKRVYVGKLTVDGNYQTLTPDIFGLAQKAFRMKVTGLLNANEVYSNYWNTITDKFYQIKVDDNNNPILDENGKEQYNKYYGNVIIKELDLIRAPHIAFEHCLVVVANNPCMQYWYKYQKTGYLTSMYDTNLMTMNSADTDGDHITGIYQKDIISAAKRTKAHTIDFVQLPILSDEENKKKKADRECSITDVNKLMECDVLGFQNDIGTVVNLTSILWSIISKDEEEKDKIQKFIKVMSIIDSLVIDFVKTGEKAEIPPEIKNMFKNYKKPYFMKYLNKKAIRKEKSTRNNIVRYNRKDGEDEIPEVFTDTNCTMNRICHYMEQQLQGLKIGIETELFDFTKLLHSEINNQNKTYKTLKQRLIDLQNEQYEINSQKYHDKDISNEQKQDYLSKYQQFYTYVKTELLQICNNVDKLVDYLVTIYYTDKDFTTKNDRTIDKAILWNSFSSQMINLAKGIERYEETIDFEALKIKADKNKDNVKKLNDSKNIVRIKPLDNTMKVKISKEEISIIKKIIPTNIKNYEEARRYLFVLLVIYRKLNANKKTMKNGKPSKDKPIIIYENTNNQINYSQLQKLTNIDIRHFSGIIQILQDVNAIHVDLSSMDKPKITVLLDGFNGESSIEIDDINECSIHLNRSFPYLKKNINKKKKVS